MTDTTFDAPDHQQDQQIEFPLALPVLPLGDRRLPAVDVTACNRPGAFGAADDDVVAGDRLLALVTTRDGHLKRPAERHLRRRHRRPRAQDDQVPDGTLRSSCRASTACSS